MPPDPPAPEDPTPDLARLPAGRHGLPRDFVSANHRGRLLAGCIAAVEERGYADFTVADVIKQAAVSRRTFYEHFASKEDCFLAAYDLIVTHVRGLATRAMGEEEEWPRQVRAAFVAVLSFFAAEPSLARIGLVEPLTAGGEIAAHYGVVIEDFVELLDAGRPSGVEVDRAVEVATLAGIVALLARRVAAGSGEQIEGLLPDLLEGYLAPSLGLAEAERIARE